MRGQKRRWHVVHALHSAFMQFETQSNLHMSSLQVSMTSSAVAPIAGTFAVETAATAALSSAAAASLGAIALGKSHCRKASQKGACTNQIASQQRQGGLNDGCCALVCGCYARVAQRACGQVGSPDSFGRAEHRDRPVRRPWSSSRFGQPSTARAAS